jgi:hydrogenase nickel incorporation protein HypA/HybF
MHELSICQSLLIQVAQLAKDHQAQQVAQIVVQIGPLSGIVPELLAQAFTIARADTVAHSAELILEILPVRVRCLLCGAETQVVDANRLICAHCGDWQTQLISGDEMLLTKIEFILMAH